MRATIPALALALVACGSTHTENSSFDEWCEGDPCGWTVEAGEVRPVSTWHEEDKAAELVGPDVRMSQLLWRDEELPEACLDVTALADVGEGPTLHVELDIRDDGVVDHVEPITSDEFTRETFALRLPPFELGSDDEWFRLRIVKTGAGRAVLAELAAHQQGASCPDAPLVTPLDP